MAVCGHRRLKALRLDQRYARSSLTARVPFEPSIFLKTG